MSWCEPSPGGITQLVLRMLDRLPSSGRLSSGLCQTPTSLVHYTIVFLLLVLREGEVSTGLCLSAQEHRLSVSPPGQGKAWI